MSVPQNREHHYRNLRDRYMNCTYVDGNLELTWLQDEHLDLGFLRYIREVTGYVLISHVDVSKIVLPRLQIIRGRTLFKLNIQDEEFALLVTLSKMNSLEIPGLRGTFMSFARFYEVLGFCISFRIFKNMKFVCAKLTIYRVIQLKRHPKCIILEKNS